MPKAAMVDRPRLILASQSRARRMMLENAGVEFEAIPASIDETSISAKFWNDRPQSSATDLAGHLAIAKAVAVSIKYPGAYVIGSDQVVAEGRHCFSKVETRQAAREVLQSLRGRTHELVSAVALVAGGEVLWQTVDRARLSMRDFSDPFLDDYLDRAGERVLWSAGCYELEGLGVQLFDSVEGDYFTILGMPLLELLTEMRRRGLVMT